MVQIIENLNPQKCAATQLLTHDSTKFRPTWKNSPSKRSVNPLQDFIFVAIFQRQKRGKHSHSWKWKDAEQKWIIT